MKKIDLKNIIKNQKNNNESDSSNNKNNSLDDNIYNTQNKNDKNNENSNKFTEFELDKIAFNNVENLNANKILTSDLWNIYKTVQKNHLNFKNNIFFKNLENLFNDLGKFDKNKNMPHSFSMKNIEPILNEVKTPEELLLKYEKKAKEKKV